MDATLEQQLIPKSLTAQAQIQHPNKSLPQGTQTSLRIQRFQNYKALVFCPSAEGIPFLDCWKGQDSYFKIN